jgi:serine protease Do
MGLSRIGGELRKRKNIKRRSKMKFAKFFFSVILIVGIVVGGSAWTIAAPPAVQQTTPLKQAGQTDISGELDQYFQKAREAYTKDANETAAQIRKAAVLLELEANQAKGEARELLLGSSKELEGLAAQVQRGTLKTAQDLDNAFSRAHTALANYYQERASESWAKKAYSDAGQSLKAAALNLEGAWEWSKIKVEKASQAAVESAKVAGDNIAKGSGWVGTEVSKSIDEIGREIGKLRNEKKSDDPPVTISTVPLQEANVSSVNLSSAIIEVAKTNIPAVVHIEVTERREVPNPFLPFEENPFFRHFFGVPRNIPKKFRQEMIGVGTGMIIDREGHILTNNHVVGGASKIVVTLSDGAQYDAKVVGTDAKTDLGVIKISAGKNLPFVTFGDSDQVQVGQWVVAIGQPRNLAESVTQGIISATHRTGITDPTSYQDFLQTDAAINPGNSGGPLLTLGGKVIGVNSAILSESGGFEGIGFAIPSNMAVHVAEQLIKNGKVIRGWMGVSVQNVTPDLAKSFGLELPKGALIADVVKGGPADKAGLKRGDVILAYQGKEIPDSSMLRNDVANTAPGDEATVTIWRDKKKEEIKFKVGNTEELAKTLAATLKRRLGAEVRPLTPEEAQQYGMSTPGGVVIEKVDPQGPLGKAGFEVGDAILTVDNKPVLGLEGFVGILSGIKPHETVTIFAVDHRTGQTGNVEVQLN